MLALQAARIDTLGVMRERSHEMVRLALLLRRTADVIAVRQENLTAVQSEVDSVRARVEAGVGRMSDLREARLIALDEEIIINRAQAEQDQIRERLAAEFDLNEDDARDLVRTFLSRRPTGLPVLQADRSDKAHAIRLRTREVTHQAAEIRGSRYPKLDGVIEGTIFDMTDYEETAWRKTELKSSLDALARDHNREMEGLAQRFQQQIREESEALARLFHPEQPAIGQDDSWHGGIEGGDNRHLWRDGDGREQRITIIAEGVADLRRQRDDA